MNTESEIEIDWGAYATQYDLLCNQNDSYEENIRHLIDYIKSLSLRENCNIADVGAGTGNFICELSSALPKAHFTHIDSNREMNCIALKKYEEQGIKNVQIIEEDARLLALENQQFDLILCVNSLYAMAPQPLVLAKLKDWLTDEGKLYIIDLGRKMNSMDWGLHFLRQAYRDRRLLDYLADTFLRGREVIKQNRLTTVAQETGRYWMHNTEDFGEMLRNAGFTVELLQSCYRGYADLAVCSRKNQSKQLEADHIIDQTKALPSSS